MIVYHVDDTTTVTALHRQATLDELQALVGGYIEAVPGSDHRAFCNEEGLLLGLPFNARASLRFGVPLVGPVVELEPGEAEQDAAAAP